MLEHEKIDKKLSKYFSIIKEYIKTENKAGNFDINNYSENFFKEILNKIYKLDLVNLNEIKVNFPAIDLGDLDEGVCFQVTSDNSRDKIITTLSKYEEKELYKKYPDLIILILGAKKSYKELEQKDKYQFDIKSNVIDIEDVILAAKKLKLKKKSEMLHFIEENISLKTGEPNLFERIIEEEVKLPRTFSKYMKFVKNLDDDEYKETFKSYRKLFEEIGNLDIDTRAVLHAIYYKRNKKITDKERTIIFDRNVIYPYLRISKEYLYEKLTVLFDLDWYEPKGERYEQYDSIGWEPDDFDVLYDFFIFCDYLKLDTKVVLKNLDFTCFD
ncbi:SMEK domain-containing protein [Fusibacter bizertensis]|uniref:SMEK domain-containing protein n=1 Tax=Fusibacter bizertensis TaxID=1488331 RepID=A0ABT6N979_9FIRM|nr:SMEK domain-containing protein [Fusibacter bizertensis]MDH8676965.1 SMEK domain-containing protein [Fusibacter bizertensis]